jgi:BirA family transcriptional regulator, biotin operon repressor / biotin---[acetyl-CoA-carboxylase] ligase
MDKHTLQNALKDLDVPDIHFFEETDSTNERALALANQGAKEYTLVIAERQTAGRGRFGRLWETTPGTSLAFTLILHPTAEEQERMSLFSFLGAVAICGAIEDYCEAKPLVKWPNDVLLGGKKTCGILAETSWRGNILEGLVLGIGVNLLPGSVPPADRVMYPATCVQTHCENEINRFEFLKSALSLLIKWRPKALSRGFLEHYRARLAFLGERVILSPTDGDIVQGLMVGVDDFGNLLMENDEGLEKAYPIGDLRLRKTL